jgi:hypothetical protein
VIPFRWRRRIHRLQFWWETDDFVVDCRNLVYRIKHPIIWRDSLRHRAAWRHGQVIIEV